MQKQSEIRNKILAATKNDILSMYVCTLCVHALVENISLQLNLHYCRASDVVARTVAKFGFKAFCYLLF